MKRIEQETHQSPEGEQLESTFRSNIEESIVNCDVAISEVTTKLEMYATRIQGLELWTEQIVKALKKYSETLTQTLASVERKESVTIVIGDTYIKLTSPEQLLMQLKELESTLINFLSLSNSAESFKEQGIKLLDKYSTPEASQVANVTLSIESIPNKELDVSTFELDPNKTYTLSYTSQEDFSNHRQAADEIHKLLVSAKLQNKPLPIIILHVEGGLPSYERDYFDYFLHASTSQEIASCLLIAKELKYTEENKPDFMEGKALSDKQANLYNNSDLRVWEGKTASTTEAIRHKLKALSGAWVPDELTIGDRHPRLVLDVGIGEARIDSIMVILGKKIVGIDLSEEQLKKVYSRLEEEIAKYEKGDPSSPLVELVNQRIIQKEQIITDLTILKANLIPIKGNMLDLREDTFEGLRQKQSDGLVNANNLFGSGAKEDLSNAKFGKEFFFNNPFEMVSFDWHTFCDAGTQDNQRKVLREAFFLLCEGGLITIEIPDRTVGTYAKSLAAYHNEHPQEPYGTIRDETSTAPGVANTVETSDSTPRFFPGRREIANLLRATGFVDVQIDTYLVTTPGVDGMEQLEVKELVVSARKPGTKGQVPKHLTPEEVRYRYGRVGKEQ